jgi:hypothetical protein
MVLALALLAGLKIWAQDSVYRSATAEALVAAYRDRAIASCQKAPSKDARAASPVNWGSTPEIKLVIGNGGISVYIWEVDHELWNARFRNPYLVLSAHDHANVACTYDIGRGTAEVSRT